MSGDSNTPNEPPATISENSQDDILSIEEVELPAKPLTVGAQGVGQSESQYELIAGIARGGMGEIFLANRARVGHPVEKVIVKRLLAQLRHRSEQLAMFRAEAEVMHRLDHPNIVAIVDEPLIDEQPCLAMEYIHGRNIDQLLCQAVEKRQPVPIEVMLYIMIELLSGLDHVHNATLENGSPLKLVHRDLTPGNVIISFSGDVKITDFGISKSQMSRVSTTVGIVKGKARYLAPEQIVGEPATPRSDLFACACVCAEIIQGKPLFDASSVHQVLHAIVNGKRRKISELLHRKHHSIAQVIEKALSTTPKKRHGSAREFREDLEKARDSLGLHFSREELGIYLQDLFTGHLEPWEEPPKRDVLEPTPVMVKSEISEDSHETGESITTSPSTMRSMAPDTESDASDAIGESTEQAEAKTHVAIQVERDSSYSKPEQSAEVVLQTGVSNSRANVDFLSQLQKVWPVLFATFGLGLVTGVIVTLLVMESNRKTEQAIQSTQPRPTVDASLPNRQALKEPTTNAQPLVIEAVTISQTASVSASTKGTPKTETRSIEPEIYYGSLTLLGPKGARVSINGKRIRKRLPLVKYKLPTGKHRVQVTKGKFRRNVLVNVTRSQNTKVRLRKKRRSKRR